MRGMFAKSKSHNPSRNVWETQRGTVGSKDREGVVRREGKEVHQGKVCRGDLTLLQKSSDLCARLQGGDLEPLECPAS